MHTEYVSSFRTRTEDGIKATTVDFAARMEARIRAAKPQFTKEQLEAAEKLTPDHLFQGADVEFPKVP